MTHIGVCCLEPPSVPSLWLIQGKRLREHWTHPFFCHLKNTTGFQSCLLMLCTNKQQMIMEKMYNIYIKSEIQMEILTHGLRAWYNIINVRLKKQRPCHRPTRFYNEEARSILSGAGFLHVRKGYSNLLFTKPQTALASVSMFSPEVLMSRS